MTRLPALLATALAALLSSASSSAQQSATTAVSSSTAPASTTRPSDADKPHAEVVWERELTPADKLRYTNLGAAFSLPADTSIDEIKKIYAAKPPPADTYKVEVIRDPKHPDEILLKFHDLGPVIAVVERANKWRTDVGKTFALGRTFNDYTYQGASCGASDSSESLFPVTGIFVGHACEYYRDTIFGPIDDEMYDVPDKVIDTHEFARLFVHAGPFKLVKTEYGYMVEVVVPRALPNEPARNPPARQLMWLSGEHHALCLREVGDRVYDFLPIYAKAFPSSLPADVKVDPIAWSIAEIDLQLAQLKLHLDDPVSSQGNLFESHMYLLQNTIYSPLWNDRYAWRPQSTVDQPRRYQAFSDWWSANKDKVVWDESLLKLVVPGQRPADTAALKLKEAKAHEEALLNAPFTADDQAAAEKAFQAVWQEELKRTLQSITMLVEKDKAAIRSGQNADDGYFIEFPLMNKTERREYAKPKFVRQDNPQLPLRAEIAMRRTLPDNGHADMVISFVYEKTLRKWSRN